MAYGYDKLPVRRSRTCSRVAELSENGGVGREAFEPEVICDVVRKHSGLVSDILVQDFLNLDRIGQNVIEAGVGLDGEQVRGETVVGEVSADRWVLDNDWDTEGGELAGVTDTGELENLGRADGASRENNLLSGCDGDGFCEGTHAGCATENHRLEDGYSLRRGDCCVISSRGSRACLQELLNGDVDEHS